jgi:mono/diheme cytochrome c family protein
MRFATQLRRLVAALAGSLFIVACSQADDQTESAKVHAAETAAGSIDELMAAGKGIYEANCGACHQANGKGLYRKRAGIQCGHAEHGLPE